MLGGLQYNDASFLGFDNLNLYSDIANAQLRVSAVYPRAPDPAENSPAITQEARIQKSIEPSEPKTMLDHGNFIAGYNAVMYSRYSAIHAKSVGIS